MSVPDQSFHKKLRYRAWRRGTREMDLLLGRFADATLAKLSGEELTLFERLIAFPDPLLWELLQNPDALEEEALQALVKQIKSFHENGHTRT